ncbi:MAG TPA: replicative DNA helicase [Saprospiraceae bacterium]|nr:replicative DNA helicase [Saprospiraceae bacterium]
MSEPVKNTLRPVGGAAKSPAADFSTIAYERIQPQANDLEEAVLGSIMLDKNAINEALEVLRPESFYKPVHQKIFNAMMILFNQTQPIDILSVSEQLRKSKQLDEVGGLPFILELSNKVSSSANIGHYARIVSQKYLQRELIRVSTLVIKDAFEDTKDVFDMLDSAEQNLYAITDKNLRRGYESVGSLAYQAQKQLELLAQNTEQVVGIPSGFPDLDKITSGWQKSNLIIVAARPGMGKTSFTLALARNAAMDFRKPVALFSLEMNNLELVNRLISMEAEVEGGKLRSGKLTDPEWTKIHSAIQSLSDAPIYIDDTPSLNVFELRAKCRRLHQHHGVSLVIIDYLQLMTMGSNDKRGSREQEISSISRALKSLAKELNIPVIALSQLNRAAETQGSKRPQLSHLRESGAIEQDADMVLFIYRTDYYELDDKQEIPKGYTELIIAKHRNGAVGSVFMKFKNDFAKFVPVDSGFGDMDFGGNLQVLIKQSKLNEDDEVPF